MTTPATNSALATERRLHPQAQALSATESVGHAKVLLVRRLVAPDRVDQPLRPTAKVSLRPISSAADWRLYAAERIAVEAGFGVSRDGAVEMVRALRERVGALAMDLYFAYDADNLVGAGASFQLPPPEQGCARLQEIDVFPQWRGRGYGDGLLAALIARLRGQGCATVVLGADEDDWPLHWYRRRGFRDAARVRLTR